MSAAIGPLELNTTMAGNFKLVIEYDGSRYHGWQRQPNGMTIQEQIETAICTMTGQKVALIGSGRTDAGVHAIGQSASFKCDTHLNPRQLLGGLNALLPEDIIIHSCDAVSAQFHARYDVKSKIYHYRILNRHLPAALNRQYHWWIRAPLDLSAMQAATTFLIGHHDFKSFEGTGSPRSHTVRHVMSARIHSLCAGILLFEIEADGFLRCMVRNIVGTLVDVGRGKIDPRRIAEIIGGRDRCLAGATAPAQGLCLIQVKY